MKRKKEMEIETEAEVDRRTGQLASSSASRGRIMVYHSSLQELFFNLPSSSRVIEKISSWADQVIQRKISSSEEEEEVLPCHH